MNVICIIPARYNSKRFPGKLLVDLFGKPMLCKVYENASNAKLVDRVIVATDSEKVAATCKQYEMEFIMTADTHETPSSRIYEVSTKIDADYYVFLGGDEPLIDPDSIDTVVGAALDSRAAVTHGMTKIRTAPEVIDFTNIKVVINPDSYLLYSSRSPLPYPKGGLSFDYKKFVGIGVFNKNALKAFYDTPQSELEHIEECDLIRFLELGIPVKMQEVYCHNVSVDTPKDFEKVVEILRGENE